MYCRRSCRQRDFESRQRARELGLAESDLIVARRQVEGLDDLLFVLGCAIADVDNDIASDHSADQLRRSLDWLLEAARPVLGASERLRGAQPAGEIPGSDPAPSGGSPTGGASHREVGP